MAIPVQIISGFLGAGKTTAIRAQLDARRGERIAVIVNDFGEASFDEVTLESAQPFRITSIPGGCICCTAPEGFVDALGAVLAERPSRVLIEPTGLARPQDLIDTIRRCPHRDALELAPVIVLVDPRNLARLEADATTPDAALLREQAQGADVLVANRSDVCTPADLARFRAFAEAIWPPPLAIHVTRQGILPERLLDWPEGEGTRAPRASEHSAADAHGHAHADSTEGFRARSWKWAPAVVFSRARLTATLQEFVARDALVRFKGIFRTQEGVSRLEVAGGMLHDRLTSYRRDSRADAIVHKEVAAELEALAASLSNAVLDVSELLLDVNRIEVILPGGVVHGIDRDQLLALPDPIDDVSDRFPTRKGSAARLSALLERLGVATEGEAVVVAGDGFAAEPVALSILREGLLLHTLGGEPLPADQGGPFRLLIPEDASAEPVSCGNVKGVAKIVVRPGG